MKNVLKYTGYILVVLLIGYLLYRFSYIIIWVLISAMISFIGAPIVRFFDKMHIRKLKMPRFLSALITLFFLVLIGAGFVAIFVPLIIKQADAISSIDFNTIGRNLEVPMEWLEEKLQLLGAIPSGETLEDFIVDKIKSVVNFGSVSSVIGKFMSVTGNLFIGIFSIIFISFFFLKDENLFEDSLLLFIPLKHHDATRKVVHESKNLLIRYYIGVIIEVLGVMTLITLSLKIFGIQNALLIGFFGGLMNIIPYLGPLIGGAIGLTLGLITTLAGGFYNEILPVTLKLLGTFAVVNFIDNNILVPTIYSKSVKSHPLEIFLIIIIGGGIAGFVGMLFAVPVYTLLRVIAREFLQQFRVVQKITGPMD